jgi:hypothetical protein
MKSKITPVDLFCFFEMFHEDKVKARMNLLTYKKIIAAPFGIKDYEEIENPRSKISGVSILFDENMELNEVEIIADYLCYSPSFGQLLVQVKY